MPFRKYERTTSENYLTALPVLLARRVRLLDNKTLRAQLTSLERTISASDKETVSHPRHGNAHDDAATAVCGAIVWASQAAKLAAFESKIVAPIAAGPPRAGFPGGYSFGADTFVAPTIGSLTAPLPAPTKPAEPTKPARNAPVQAVSGYESKRRMAAVNARRDIDYKIMTE